MSRMLVSRRTVEIQWGDCDPADIVFYPNYFAWFDASTAHHFKAAGLPKPELIRRYGVVGFPMVDTRAKFHIPSRHGDEVVIETSIVRFGSASFDIEHRLLRNGSDGEEQLAVEGFEKRVLVKKKEDGSGITSCPVPEEVKVLFSLS
ncbi:MAG: acyl-CoA thioesterase [Rhizobiaceae bacterium]